MSQIPSTTITTNVISISKVSMRPVDFSCILRVSKSQMLENGTKDAAVDGVYRGVLDYLSSQSHKVS